MTDPARASDDPLGLYRGATPRRAAEPLSDDTTDGFDAVTTSEPPSPTPTPAAAARRWIPLAVLVASGMVLVGAVGAGLALRKPADVPMPRTGDCLVLTQSGDGAGWAPTDCAGDDPVVFKVSTSGAGQVICPDGPYLTYQRRGEGGGRPWACLVPQYRENRCYDTSPLVPAPVACTDTAADFKVTKVFTNETDPGRCPGGSGLPYLGDRLVQCPAKP